MYWEINGLAGTIFRGSMVELLKAEVPDHPVMILFRVMNGISVHDIDSWVVVHRDHGTIKDNELILNRSDLGSDGLPLTKKIIASISSSGGVGL